MAAQALEGVQVASQLHALPQVRFPQALVPVHTSLQAPPVHESAPHAPAPLQLTSQLPAPAHVMSPHGEVLVQVNVHENPDGQLIDDCPLPVIAQ